MVRPSLPAAAVVYIIWQITFSLWPVDGGIGVAWADRTAKTTVERDLAGLPPTVLAMREAILEAVAKGDIEALALPIELNELPPVVGDASSEDALASLRTASSDGQGIEVLAILSLVLELAPAHVDAGAKTEMYVWPYLAEVPLASLTPPERVDLYRIARGADAQRMLAAGRYTGWRLGIGPNGVWHWLEQGE